MQNLFNANSNGGIGDAALPLYSGRDALRRVRGGRDALVASSDALDRQGPKSV